jgi:hypothetical protein
MKSILRASGYRFLAVECANANSSAFAERLGFSPYDNRRRWVGSIDSIREAPEQ